jgi:hypothetical protein
MRLRSSQVESLADHALKTGQKPKRATLVVRMRG